MKNNKNVNYLTYIYKDLFDIKKKRSIWQKIKMHNY